MSGQKKFKIFGLENKQQKPTTTVVKSQPSIEVTDPKNTNLYTVLDRGDNIIQTAHRKAIIIVGLSRKGKSTLFNWMLGRNLIGYSDKEGEVPYYKLQVEADKDAAVVGNNYTSVTLAPNIYVDFEKDVSLIDMAGFQDKRNYVGVIGVSYFLKEVFQKVKQAKFIIVISQKMFEDTSGEDLIKTFQGFINMFPYLEMEDDLREKLRQSIVVVITKTTKAFQFFDKLKIILQKIMEEQFIIENKDALLEILSWLYTKLTRLQPFNAAVSNTPPQPCKFVKQLSKNESDPWTFFNFQQAEKMMLRSPVCFPFSKDFSMNVQEDNKQVHNKQGQNKQKNNKKKQSEQFTQTIQSRVKSYKGFAQLTMQFVKCFFKNWEDFIKPEGEEGSKAKDPQFYMRMRTVFDVISAYVDKNNFYEQNILKNFKYRNVSSQFNFLKAIKQIQNIFQKVQDITTGVQATFADHMQRYSKDFPQIIKSFYSFTTKVEQQKLLHKLQYILQRGFKDFSRLYELKPECIADANIKLRDYFSTQEFFDDKVFFDVEVRKNFQISIIKNMSSQLMQKMFNSLEKLDEYQAFFQDYQNRYNQSEDTLFLKQHIDHIQNLKSNLLLKTDNKPQTLRCFIRIYNGLDESSQAIANSIDSEEYQNNNALKKYSMKKIKTVRKMVNILKTIPPKENFSPLDEALQLCLNHKMIEDASQIYQLLINTPDTPRPLLFDYYRDYVHHCVSWGDLDYAIRLLKKRLVLEDEDEESYMQTIQWMKKINNQRIQKYKQFSSNLSTINILPIKDLTFKFMLSQLELKILEI